VPAQINFVFLKECGTEDIPALFWTIATATPLPAARIASGKLTCFDVLMTPIHGTDGQNIEVNWSCTIGLAMSWRVVVNEATTVVRFDLGQTANVATLTPSTRRNDSILPRSLHESNGLDAAVPRRAILSMSLYNSTTPRPRSANPGHSHHRPNTTGIPQSRRPNGECHSLKLLRRPTSRLLAVFPARTSLVWKTISMLKPAASSERHSTT